MLVFTENTNVTCKYHHKVSIWWKYDIFSWSLRSLSSLRFVVLIWQKHVFWENRFQGEKTTSGFWDFSESRRIRHPGHPRSIHKHPEPSILKIAVLLKFFELTSADKSLIYCRYLLISIDIWWFIDIWWHVRGCVMLLLHWRGYEQKKNKCAHTLEVL